MILTENQQWVDLYESIKAETRKSSEKHVNIYVSASDVDSVCSLRILEVCFVADSIQNSFSFHTTKSHQFLQNLLQNDLIPHGWLAVSRYEEIIEDFRATYDEEDSVTRYVLLINCGASEDISALLELIQRPHVCVVIIDSHRPIMHMANDNDPTSQVFVLVDREGEGLAAEDVPPAEYGNDDEDEDDDDDADRENDAENTHVPSQRRRLDNSHGPLDDSPRARREAKRRHQKSLEEQRASYYSQGAHYGKPSACILYDLAFYLQQDSSYLLWLALTGLTDHLVHSRIARPKYEEYYMRYESHIATGGHLDPLAEVAAIDTIEPGTMTSVAPTCRIAPQEDYRFGLLREWTLWDAMVNSPYVASRLQTYSEKGRQRLEFLLAKLGIPLQQAKGSYQYDMKPQFRTRLQEQIAAHGAAYNIGDALFRSFQLQDGYKRCVMAVDVVHAVTALLESGAARRSRDDTPSPAGSDHRDRFWRSWNALSWRDDNGELRKGIELAKKVQIALVADGGAVVVQRLYHNFRAFRIFDLSDHKLTNQSLLGHPMALQRLAAFFQEQHAHQGQNNRRKPVVLIGPRDAVTGRCLVVGYQVTAPGRGNRLGDAFAAATEEVHAQAWHDLFDTSIMEIMSDDVERFKAELLRVATDLL